MNRTIYAMVLLAIFSSVAHAAEATVTIPWGDWLSAGADNLLLLILALLGWALRQLPANINAIIKTWQVEQLMSRAIEYGINKTAGAAKGQQLTFVLANDVLAKAIQYAVDSAPGWLVTWVGGEEGLRDKIIARLDLKPEVAL